MAAPNVRNLFGSIELNPYRGDMHNHPGRLDVRGCFASEGRMPSACMSTHAVPRGRDRAD